MVITSWKHVVAQASVAVGAVTGLVAVDCAPEQHPMRFLSRFTFAVGLSSAISAVHLSRGALSQRRHKPPMWRTLLGGVFALALGVFVFHASAVVFGASLVGGFERTLAWSAMMSALTTLPCGLVLGVSRPVSWLLKSSPKPTLARWSVGVPAACAALGAWLGAVPIPLDWDRPWQVWPVSCTYGAIGGYLFGCCIAVAFGPSAKIEESRPRPPTKKTQ